jgi:2-oxoglutarate dehydrogenase E2 component (dihydrolipoamide succinyltransferase)
MANVTMPQLGETVADGTVTKWFKKVGDVVVKGEPLFEVSTDKVDTEIPAQTDGVLSAILIEEGVTVDVGTTLAIIDSGLEDPLTRATPVVGTTPVNASSTGTSARDATETSNQLSPAVRRLLEEHQLRADQMVGSGPLGRLTRGDVEAYVAAQGHSPAPITSLPMSPVVRRLLNDHHLDAASLVGTGPNGQLTRHDVENAISESATSGGETRPGDETIPFTKARRLTAEHMVRSKATSAHTLMVKEVDYEHVEVHRRHHGAAFKEREGYTLTYLPYVALAVLDALRAFPQINASVGHDELVVHHNLNLGIAVDLDGGGLVVPVIHDADRFDLWTMARQIRDLATRAKQKKLTVDDVTGGTFTITNPGPFGTFLTGAVINQPQIAILATDGVTRKPVVVTSPTGEESIVIHSAGLLALTFDHRAIDGAAAARFLNHVTAQLNGRDWTDEH